MDILETPHHSGPPEMPNTSRFLSDEEYRLIQNNIVIGCTDVLLVDQETGEALSGYRQQKPQEGYWFSCGGRMQRGQSYQQAGAAKIKEELGLEIDPSRLEFLTAYSTAFNERAQQPSEEGVHTSNAVVVLFISPEERAQMEIALNKEHRSAEWTPVEEIITKKEQFPGVLRDAIEKLSRNMCADFSNEQIEEFFGGESGGTFEMQTVNVPEKDFLVPKGVVYFELFSSSMQSYGEKLWATRMMMSYLGGEKVQGIDPNAEAKYGAKKYEGVMLAPGKSKKVETLLLGMPVTTLLENKDGYGRTLIGVELPEKLVHKAIEIQEIFTSGRDIPTAKEAVELFKLSTQIKRHLRRGDDYSAMRQSTAAPHYEHRYYADGTPESVSIHYPEPASRAR